jgi:DNA-binding CsgD family transcriptional regulator
VDIPPVPAPPRRLPSIDDGDRPGAARWFLACLEAGVTVGYWPAVAWGVMGSAGLAVHSGRTVDAARLHGAVRPHLDLIRRHTPPERLVQFDRLIVALREQLGDDFESESDRGEALGWSAAVELARRIAGELSGCGGYSVSARPARRRRGPRANPDLTDRELDVLRELIVGQTNQSIADRLGVSAKTVMHHTGSVYRKLGVRGRAEAIAHALRVGLVA